jgi:pseudouridine-5'-phosphate glycosidase
MNSKFLEFSEEVNIALKNGLPIVALESTIISHGMPYPKNVETAILVEEEIRKLGAVPATIAIRDGKCLVGLTKDDIEFIGTSENVWKVSLRDMPYILSLKIPGATTVASTMRIASLAGIKIFATGGIGGVHRGGENSMDISADLTEMSQTNVAIVSAGVKSILDIGLTLEYLETKGIPVITYKQLEFPSFYSSKSGFISPLHLDTPDEIASVLKIKWNLGIQGSVLIANPILPEYEVEEKIMEMHIKNALVSAEKNRIRGKAVTPYILKHISEQTNGESLEANIALIKSNARLAAEIAIKYHQE